jgi:hypothetical protein
LVNQDQPGHNGIGLMPEEEVEHLSKSQTGDPDSNTRSFSHYNANVRLPQPALLKFDSNNKSLDMSSDMGSPKKDINHK